MRLLRVLAVVFWSHVVFGAVGAAWAGATLSIDTATLNVTMTGVAATSVSGSLPLAPSRPAP